MKKVLLLLAIAAVSFGSCKKCYKCEMVGTYYGTGQTVNKGTYETCSKDELEMKKQYNSKLIDNTGQEVGTIEYVCE